MVCSKSTTRQKKNAELVLHISWQLKSHILTTKFWERLLRWEFITTCSFNGYAVGQVPVKLSWQLIIENHSCFLLMIGKQFGNKICKLGNFILNALLYSIIYISVFFGPRFFWDTRQSIKITHALVSPEVHSENALIYTTCLDDWFCCCCNWLEVTIKVTFLFLIYP